MWRNIMKSTKSQKVSVLHYNIDKCDWYRIKIILMMDLYKIHGILILTFPQNFGKS